MDEFAKSNPHTILTDSFDICSVLLFPEYLDNLSASRFAVPVRRLYQNQKMIMRITIYAK